MQTPDNFTSLADLLLPPLPAKVEETAPSTQGEEAEGDASEHSGALEDARLFRARLSEALECTLERLCNGIAHDVLARELLLAPADVRAICERLMERYVGEGPVRIRVHPSERDALHGFDVPVVEDVRVQRGGLILDVCNGALDASLDVRLEHVLLELRR